MYQRIYRVFNTETQQFVKVGRGVWLRRSDMIQSLYQNGYITSRNAHPRYQWVVEHMQIVMFDINGMSNAPLNPPAKRKGFKVPVTGMAGNSPTPWMYRSKYDIHNRNVLWITPAQWADKMSVLQYNKSYVTLYSDDNKKIYFMGITDYIKATTNGAMVNSKLIGTFEYVKRGTVYGIKVVY